MIKVSFEARLNRFEIVNKNEASDDEPFLWPIFLRFDGSTAGDVFGNPGGAKVAVGTPRMADGGHGNLGVGAEGLQRLKPVAIPLATGQWKSALTFDETVNLRMLAQYCTIALAAVGVEEDGTSDFLAAEAHRRALIQIKKDLNKAVRKLLTDVRDTFQIPDEDDLAKRLLGAVTEKKVTDAIKTIVDDLTGGLILRGLFNIFSLCAMFPELDRDDFVGFKVVGPYFLPDLIGDAIDGNAAMSDLHAGQSLLSWLQTPLGTPEPALTPNEDWLLGVLRILGMAESPKGTFHIDTSGFPPSLLGALSSKLTGLEDGRYRVYSHAQRTDLLEPPTLGAIWSGGSAFVYGRGENDRCVGAAVKAAAESASVWREQGSGTFSSGVAAALSADGTRLHLAARGKDKEPQIWASHDPRSTPPDKRTWSAMPKLPSPARYGPAVAVAGAGKRVDVFAVAQDHRVRWSFSSDHGQTWDLTWGFVGKGTLDSSPAAGVSDDGRHVHVFGLGGDRRIWRAHTPDGGAHFDALWSPMMDQKFKSAPGCAVSPSGTDVAVAARAEDGLYFAYSRDAGHTWRDNTWFKFALPEGSGTDMTAFISAPALCFSPDLRELHVFCVWRSLRMARAVSGDFGLTWSNWEYMRPHLFA